MVARYQVVKWDNLNQAGIIVWRRESQPLMLILLNKFKSQRFLPPFLPPNDRLRQADFLDY